MSRSVLIRSLRIVWTAVFGVTCLIVVAFWTRSYYRFDWFGPGVVLSQAGNTFRPQSGFVFESANGTIAVWYEGNLNNQNWWIWSAGSSSPDTSLRTVPILNKSNWYGFSTFWSPSGAFFGSIPHCCLAAFAGVLATSVWGWPRYSLKILLVAITSLSVVLGIAVYLRQ